MILLLLFTASAGAEERYAWLRDRPIKKQRVFASNVAKTPLLAAPKASLVISNVDSRRRSLTVSNRKEIKKTGVLEIPKKSPVVSDKDKKSVVSKAEKSTESETVPMQESEKVPMQSGTGGEE